MDEFNSRMEAQRKVLGIVNAYKWNEQLTSLSADAIERWLRENRSQESESISDLLFNVSKALLCLAIKSQEQVTDEYSSKVIKVEELSIQLKTALEECWAIKQES